MPRLKTYRLFIAHAWDYGQYDRIVGFLNDTWYFKWVDYSIPEDDPLHVASGKELRKGIRKRIGPTNCVIVIAAMNVPYREWIQVEMEISQALDKPIIGVLPWGARQVPRLVQEVATEIVGWRVSSIVSAIRRNAE